MITHNSKYKIKITTHKKNKRKKSRNLRLNNLILIDKTKNTYFFLNTKVKINSSLKSLLR